MPRLDLEKEGTRLGLDFNNFEIDGHIDIKTKDPEDAQDRKSRRRRQEVLFYTTLVIFVATLLLASWFYLHPGASTQDKDNATTILKVVSGGIGGYFLKGIDKSDSKGEGSKTPG